MTQLEPRSLNRLKSILQGTLVRDICAIHIIYNVWLNIFSGRYLSLMELGSNGINPLVLSDQLQGSVDMTPLNDRGKDEGYTWMDVVLPINTECIRQFFLCPKWTHLVHPRTHGSHPEVGMPLIPSVGMSIYFVVVHDKCCTNHHLHTTAIVRQ